MREEDRARTGEEVATVLSHLLDDGVDSMPDLARIAGLAQCEADRLAEGRKRAASEKKKEEVEDHLVNAFATG